MYTNNKHFEVWRVPAFFILYVGASHIEQIRKIRVRKGFHEMATYHTREGKLDAVQFKVEIRHHRSLKTVIKKLEKAD